MEQDKIHHFINPEDLTPAAMAKRQRESGGQPVNLNIYYLHGIFGELDNCNGVGEYLIFPAAGGCFMKIVGCSYLYKGNPQQAKVFGLEQAKSNVSTLPREIIGKSILYSGAVALRCLLQRKKFIHDLHVFMEEIRWKTLRHHSIPESQTNNYSRELRRAFDVSLKKLFKIDPERDLCNTTHPENIRFEKIEIAALIAKIVAFMAQFIELDCAYRFPVQDVFGEMNVEWAREDGVKEFMRLLDIYCERGVKLQNRIKFIRKVLKVYLLVSPQSRQIINAFMQEVDPSKIALDEADYYFCLRRNTYNFRGKTLEERMEELKVIDKEKNHKYIEVQFKQA